MKVIICGAGQVGSNIAHYLAQEKNDVTVIDQSAELIRIIGDTLDVRTVVGHASHPDVLENAGANDADMIIAVTQADEVNMVACQVAHSLFDMPTKIARIRDQSYLAPVYSNLFSRDHMPIDVIISPEIEVAHAVTRRLRVPGAFDVIPLVNDAVRLIGVHAEEDCPLLNTPLRQLTRLFPELNIIIVAIIREDEGIVPHSDEEIHPGDDVYFVVDSTQTERAMAAFGHDEPEARRLVIFGGGNIGMFLAQEIEEKYPWVNTKIIEHNQERAEYVAQNLNRSVVLHGDVLDPVLQEEAAVGTAETVVSVTNDDETNILAALLAKRSGAQRATALVNSTTYPALITSLGIDVVVSPRNITVSTILQHVRRGRIYSVHTIRDDFGELIEAEALDTSPLVGKPLKEADLPEGVLVGALVRDKEILLPTGSTVIQGGDRVVLFAKGEVVPKVEKLFSVRLEYF